MMISYIGISGPVYIFNLLELGSVDQNENSPTSSSSSPYHHTLYLNRVVAPRLNVALHTTIKKQKDS